MMNDNEQEIRAHIEKIAYPTFEQRVREWIAAGKLGAPYTVLEQIFLMAKAGGEGVVPVRNNFDQTGSCPALRSKRCARDTMAPTMCRCLRAACMPRRPARVRTSSPTRSRS